MVTLEELRQKHRQIIESNTPGESKTSDYAKFDIDVPALVRILPGKEEPLDFFVETTVHKFQDSAGSWKSYHCRRTINEDCPLCNLRFELWDKHKALKLPPKTKSKYGDLATQLKQRSRYFVKAVIRSLVEADTTESPVKFIAMSNELFDRVMAAVTEPDLADETDPENTTILSLERGNDFEVVVNKQGDYNTFKNSKPKIKKTRAGTPKQIQEWMDSPLNLKSLVKEDSYEDGKLFAQSLLASLHNEAKSEATTNSNDSDDDVFEKELKV